MENDLISRQAAVDEIHKYFLSEMDKEETKTEDGWEVYANMPHVNELLTHNKQICTRIKALPPTDISAKKVGEWDMFDLISSAYYGKGMYFKQDNDIVYSRYSCKHMTVDEALREFISLIDDSELPSAEPKWIPVTERLPESQTEVIVSCTDDSGDTKFRYTSSGWVTTDKEYWIVDNEVNNFVVAWREMPEPWKGEDE